MIVHRGSNFAQDDKVKEMEAEKPDMRTRAAIRRLVAMIATHIDPDVTVEKIKIGEKETSHRTTR